MPRKSPLYIGGAIALCLALIALPGHSLPQEAWQDSARENLQTKLETLQAKLERLQLKLGSQHSQLVELASFQELAPLAAKVQELQQLSEPGDANLELFLDGRNSSWLGVETREVSSDLVKELKLPAERGVLVGKVIPKSPADLAGLKEKDVITELNGQPLESATQFRRMIHEIPAGRSVQLTVWRDAHSLPLNATLGKSEERGRNFFHPSPGAFAFRGPEAPEALVVPDLPSFEFDGHTLFSGGPRLGIDAQDLSGQLGSYFGAPDGAGVLVRSVNSGTPAEKAGVKAGDVIVSLNGERIHSSGELREKLAQKRDDKDRTVKLGVLRNKSELSFSAELPAPVHKSEKRLIMHRTNI